MNKPDVLAIIDSKSKPAQIVSEVLLGATSAPIYFEIPYKIGTQNYIPYGPAMLSKGKPPRKPPGGFPGQNQETPRGVSRSKPGNPPPPDKLTRWGVSRFLT